MRIILLRHGQTEGNRQGRYIGRIDEPLCAQGLSQAQAAGRVDDMACVYVSPMLRAIQTAKICFPNAQMRIIDDLREMDFGSFEGRTAEEMAYDADYRKWVRVNCEGRCPNGEEVSAFRQRVQAAFEDIVGEAIERKLKELAVVAHGGTIMAVMSEYARPKRAFYDWHVPHCRGYETVIGEGEWKQRPCFAEYKYLHRLK